MLRLTLSILAAGILMAGCATAPTEPPKELVLPPISVPETSNHNPGQIIWHDLATRDLELSKSFYSSLFGWAYQQIDESPRQYTAVYMNGKMIGGMFTFEIGEKENSSGEWLMNISSSDVAGDAAKFEKAGGKILGKAREIPERGTSSFIEDPQKALLILSNSSTGDPEEGAVHFGDWLWNELWTSDATAALSLYSETFGYEGKPMDGGNGEDYFLLLKNDFPVGGILQMKVKDVRPHWVPFIRVADVAASVTKAVELGGNVLIKPAPEIRDGKVALIQGPTGEPIVVQEFEFNRN